MAMTDDEGTAGQVGPQEDLGLEDMVRGEVRAWLDREMPALVRSLVDTRLAGHAPITRNPRSGR
jgi:hypothetical protein